MLTHRQAYGFPHLSIMTKPELKQEIVDIVKKEYACGMVNMFEGNASAKIDNTVLITPSQISKEKMTPDMIIEVDMDGNILHCADGLKPSSELQMHLEVYRLRKDVRAIVHNHSLYATAFAMNNMPVISDSLTEMNMTFGQVPVVPYGAPGTQDIYKDFNKYLGNYNAVLLANHGVLTFGATLELAYSYAEAVEKLANTIFIARQLGSESKIPQEELENLRAHGDSMRTKAIEEATK